MVIEVSSLAQRLYRDVPNEDVVGHAFAGETLLACVGSSNDCLYNLHEPQRPKLEDQIRLQDFARTSLECADLLRSRYPGGPIDAVELDWTAPRIGNAQRRQILELSDEAWKRARPGDFDGSVIGVFDMLQHAGSLRLACCEMPYRSFLAAESMLRTMPQVRIPLALGIHALVFNGESVLVLVMDNGLWSIPGGAVDYADRRAAYERPERGTLATAILREIREESGLDPSSPEILVTGAYIGARPPHIALMAAMQIDNSAGSTLSSDPSWRPDPREHIDAIRWMPLAQFRANASRLSLSARTALHSLDHCTSDFQRESDLCR